MNTQLSTASVQFDVTIHSPIETVWDCLLNETTNWWSKDFYTSAKSKEFHIEGRIGGKAYEDFGNGEGLIWAEVIGVDAPHSLQMKGLLSPEFGGPAVSYLSIKLQSSGSDTIFTLSDTLMGAVNEQTGSQIESGWRMIYAEAFKNYVENK